MARDPGLIQIELENLRSIRAGGVHSIREGDREVAHRSDAEIVAAIRALEAELAKAVGATQPQNVIIRTAPAKGW